MGSTDVNPSIAWPLAGGLIIFVGLMVLRPRMTRCQQQLSGYVTRPRDDSIRHTLLALGSTILRVLPWPVLVLSLGAIFPAGGSIVEAGLREVCYALAVLLFVFQGARVLLEPGGIAGIHFGWTPQTITRAHHQAGWILRWWLPLALAAAFIHSITPDTGDAIVPRVALLGASLMLVIHLLRGQARHSGADGQRWYQGPRNWIRLALLGTFGFQAIANVLGLVFTVAVIWRTLFHTVWVGSFFLLLYAVLTRWLRVARRRLRLQERRAAKDETQVSIEGGTIEVEQADLGDISAETLQLVNMGVFVAAAAAMLLIWEPLLPAFDAFTRVTLWTSTAFVEGEAVVSEITLATLVRVLLLAGLTLFAAKKLPALVELVLRSRTGLSPSTRYTAGTLLNYVIVGAGIVAALSELGLQWSQLQWLVAALGVGIGFGLQEIVANFISGVIILFERPVRVGDIVTIGDKDGTVTKIRIRATTIRDWDGKELLVPNKEFITGRVVNWTLSDTQTRLVIPVGIAYGSDVDLAMKTLEDVIRSHTRVLMEPAPSVVFLGFGDNSLNLVGAASWRHRISSEDPLGVAHGDQRGLQRGWHRHRVPSARPAPRQREPDPNHAR